MQYGLTTLKVDFVQYSAALTETPTGQSTHQSRTVWIAASVYYEARLWAATVSSPRESVEHLQARLRGKSKNDATARRLRAIRIDPSPSTRRAKEVAGGASY